MAKRIVNKVKPTLVRVGSHMIDPNDVACISRIKSKRLCVVRLKSQPNMEFPIWINLDEMGALLKHFDIQKDDIPETDED